MTVRDGNIDLFHYLDYRKFLRDFYQNAKKKRAGFSFRSFSRKAGFGSSNFYKLVMDGDRNLTEESASKFAAALGLNKEEQLFFKNLVLFNQAKSQKEKQAHYQKLLGSRKFGKLKALDKTQFQYCSEWYHAVVRELIAHKKFDGTPEWLAAHIFPPITPAQAKKSLELLEKLGFIKKTASGRWKQTSSLVSTGAEVMSLALFSYHMSMLDLTRQVLEAVPAAKRDISALTLGVDREKIGTIKEKIRRFRREIMEFASTDTHPNEVIQLNIQLFPFTVPGGKDKE